MATIKQYKKKDGSKLWMFKTYLGMDPFTGKQRETTRRNFRTKKEAQLALSRLRVEIDKNGFKNTQTYTFRKVYDLWVVTYELTVKESTFVKQTEQYRLHILPVFGEKRIDKITTADIQKFANDNVNKFARYREFISNTSRIFDYAITMKILDINPAKNIIIPKAKTDVSKSKKLNYFTKDELTNFLSVVSKQQNKKIATFFRLLALSGARRGEILGLEWRNVSFDDNFISIKQTLARGKKNKLYLEAPKTAFSHRDIPLDLETMRQLKDWKKRQRKELLMFGHNATKKNQLVFSTLQENNFIQLSKPLQWLKKIISDNDLRPITVHGLRHTYATMMLESGLTLKDVSERLGHASIEITSDLYIHVTEKRKIENTNQVMEYLNL